MAVGNKKMRLDKFLQISRLVKRRTVANTLCSRGAVRVNGHAAKAGKMLSVGDVICLPVAAFVTAESHLNGEEAANPEYEVLELPSGNVSRARATTLYRQINP